MKPSVALTLLGFLGFCPVIHAAAYTFTTIDVPFAGAQYTQAWGINASGQIVGFYGDAVGLGLHGFLDNGGVFSSIDVPFASLGATQPFGIDADGQIVGGYGNTVGSFGFLDTGGTFTTIDVPFPNSGGIEALGVNSGQIIGSYSSGPDTIGFLDNHGIFTKLQAPFGPTVYYTRPFGINSAGQIVGDYSSPSHGFLYSGGIFSPIDVPLPGAGNPSASGINDSGQIVGSYSDATGGHGFLDNGGIFIPIDVPLAGRIGTVATGINDSGQIVGFYFDTTDHRHGFLATPIPEPASLLLITFGVAGIVVMIRRKTRPQEISAL